MEYISVAQFAGKYGISERTARKYCADGKIDGTFLTGKTWNIPADAVLPRKGKAKLTPLLSRLREEKEAKLKGGVYHHRGTASLLLSRHSKLGQGRWLSARQMPDSAGQLQTAIGLFQD